jgi:hypothetical protein
MLMNGCFLYFFFVLFQGKGKNVNVGENLNAMPTSKIHREHMVGHKRKKLLKILIK